MLLPQIVGATLASDVWLHLKATYASRAKVQGCNIKHQLLNLSHGIKSIAKYMHRMKGVADNLLLLRIQCQKMI